ncbi:hypothetical protein [Aquisalibacillus elongatus]|uniref:hypothetical protein n=1 Tax=Aquisalibacillus elongatus TaxID=485577 RepID=UPI000F5361F7|nr:hypothetical protein [Aquisalibacillus elongatus]
MDWNMYITLILFAGFLLWKEKNLTLRSFIRDSFGICAAAFILKQILDWIPFSLSPFEYLPETVNHWIGIFIIMGFTIFLSYQVWTKRNNNRNTD